MSELSWSRKYRPVALDDVAGNTRLKSELSTLIKGNKLPNALLLAGTHGTGKTTLARLVAKSLLCKDTVDGAPCGDCYSCNRLTDDYILKGNVPSDLSVYDYNISKLNRTEDAEKIVESMQAANFDGSKRVFILDEMQVASHQAQSRFLRIAEEPQDNLHIIMCTTNPEKLIEPLKSRFVDYKVKKPTEFELEKMLEEICISEGVKYSKSGLRLVISKMNRNPREVLNRAETISHTGDLTRNRVAEHLDIVSEDLYVDLIKAVQTASLPKVSAVSQVLDDNMIDFNTFVTGFGEFLTDLIEILALVKSDIYSASEIKRYKLISKGISDYQMMQLLKLVKEYATVRSDDRFILYSFATEMIDVFIEVREEEKTEPIEEPTVEDNARKEAIKEKKKAANKKAKQAKEKKSEVSEINRTKASENYISVTKGLQEESKQVKEIKKLNTDSISDLFGGEEVVLNGTPKPKGKE